MKNEDLKKIGEIQALKKFLNNKNINFNDSLLFKNIDEPADVVYDNKKYQIVYADFKFQKEINIKFFSSKARKADQIFNDFVLDPINKKKVYGKSANGHTLIINSLLDPPKSFIDNELSNIKNNVFDIGFDEIYLVTNSVNIKIFPL